MSSVALRAEKGGTRHEKLTLRSGLFLIEMVLVNLFFSICAAVSMRVFAAALQTADRSRYLSAAVLAAESAAECWKSSKGDLKRAPPCFTPGKTAHPRPEL